MFIPCKAMATVSACWMDLGIVSCFYGTEYMDLCSMCVCHVAIAPFVPREYQSNLSDSKMFPIQYTWLMSEIHGWEK